VIYIYIYIDLKKLSWFCVGLEDLGKASYVCKLAKASSILNSVIYAKNNNNN